MAKARAQPPHHSPARSTTMPRHELTTEERRRGGLTRAWASRIRAARELADERMSALTDKALEKLELLLDSEDDGPHPRRPRGLRSRPGQVDPAPRALGIHRPRTQHGRSARQARRLHRARRRAVALRGSGLVAPSDPNLPKGQAMSDDGRRERIRAL